jgi:hypothetical protein
MVVWGERTTGLPERSRIAPAALRTMKVRFGHSNLSCEEHTQDAAVVKAGLVVQRGQCRSSQHHSHERNRELHRQLRSLRVQRESRNEKESTGQQRKIKGRDSFLPMHSLISASRPMKCQRSGPMRRRNCFPHTDQDASWEVRLGLVDATGDKML